MDALVCNGEVSEAVALARLDVLFKYYFDVIGMILLIKKSVLGEEPVGCADSLDGLARHYWSKGAYDEAEPLCQEALRDMDPLHQEAWRITKSALGEEPVVWADSLDGLARLYWSKCACNEAEPLYQEALRVREPLHQ